MLVLLDLQKKMVWNIFFLPLLLHATLSGFFTNGEAHKLYRPFNNTVPAIFVFGDSTVDPGNNNYVAATIFKSNFPPYGRDFENHKPTGRFTNGKLVTDFIVSYVGVKEYVPAYLDPALSIEDLMTGVSFASASSGFDSLTATSTGVITMEKQLEYFRECKRKIEDAIGKERTKRLIGKAGFVVSACTNDLANNYFLLPIRRTAYTLPAYLQFLVQNVQQFLQGLLDEGAHTIAVVGSPPVGCLPAIITINSDDALHNRKCIEKLSSASRDYNALLEEKLKAIQERSRAMILYADIYSPFMDLIQRHSKYGFDEADVGCCGTGLLEAALLCNKHSTVCPDPSKYVFWDAVHPTERSYRFLFESIRPKIDSFLRQ